MFNNNNPAHGSPHAPGRQQSGGNEATLSNNSDRDSARGGGALPGSGAASTADGFMGRSSISTNTAGTGVTSLAEQLRNYKVRWSSWSGHTACDVQKRGRSAAVFHMQGTVPLVLVVVLLQMYLRLYF
jgi:hypothetical protein